MQFEVDTNAGTFHGTLIDCIVKYGELIRNRIEAIKYMRVGQTLNLADEIDIHRVK